MLLALIPIRVNLFIIVLLNLKLRKLSAFSSFIFMIFKFVY